MSDSDRYAPRVHVDSVLFREAVGFTAAQTGFSERLIEKDYFCTVLSMLKGQLTTRLRPVLRQSDFEEFDLDRAMTAVLRIAEAIATS